MDKLTTFYFIGKLQPEEECMKFNPGEMHLKNGWVVDIFQSGIAVWNPKVTAKFNETLPEVTEILETVVNTYNFITRSRITFNIYNCLEARGVSCSNNLIWWFTNARTKKAISKLGPNNAAWRRAGQNFEKTERSFHHKIALRDYQACMSHYNQDDAFFYAFRIIEEIREAIGGDSWEAMHRALSTSKEEIDPLTKASTAVRHGKFKHPDLIDARKKKNEIIDGIAIKIMEKEFKRSFKGLMGKRKL